MIAQGLYWLIDWWFGIFTRLTDLILEPIFNYLVDHNWIGENYLQYLQEFLNQYFYPYLKFARNVFLNVTGFPQELFAILIFSLYFIFGLFIMSLILKFIFNAYVLLRGALGAVKVGKKL